MDLQLRSTIAYLKCNNCKNYLSRFPIYSSSQHSICGRCFKSTEPEAYVENKLFETVAGFIKFPCIYDVDGCMEKSIPKSMKKHEQICAYRKINCIIEDCKWKDTYKNILDHVQQSHEPYILKNCEFELDFLNTYTLNNFIRYQNELFTIDRFYDKSDNILHCVINHINSVDSTKQFKYEIVVTNCQGTKKAVFDLKKFEDQGYVLNLNVEELDQMLGNPNVIIGKVIINDYVEKMIEAENDVKSEMLEELECPVCFEYIMPPIFQCNTGHNICDHCKPNLKQCPTCEAVINNTRNITLERICAKLKYSCRFAVYGCHFISIPDIMKDHQKHCNFGPHKCPLEEYEDCKWENKKEDILPHIIEEHQENLLEYDIVSVQLSGDEEDLCFIIPFNNNVFKLIISTIDYDLNFAVQLLGPAEECVNYVYDIEIFSLDINVTKRIHLRNICAPYSNKVDSFVDAKFFLNVGGSLLDGILLNNDLTFRVEILLKQ